jgi:glycosyltransferase involved in cell wall biosynthesis
MAHAFDSLRPTQNTKTKAAPICVVTPTFNRGHTIERALRSLQAQRFGAWEHIIIDDGSSDHTFSVVEPYLKKDPRISYIRRPNRAGPVQALNLGIAKTRSPWITFLDSDDELTPSHLQARFDFIEANPTVDLIWGGLRVTGPRARQFVWDAAGSGRRLHASVCRIAGTFVVRRSVLKRLGGFRDVSHYDYDLTQRAAAMGFELARVRVPTYIYHVEGNDRLSLSGELPS